MKSIKLPPSERLYFRTLKNTDTKRIFEIYTDAEAMKFRNNPPVANLNEAKKMISQANQETHSNCAYRGAIVKTSSNLLIGTFLCTRIDYKTYKIGFSLEKNQWGKGYGIETLKTICFYFKGSNITTLIAITHKENIGSIKILEKLSFKLNETVFTKDLLEYSLDLKGLSLNVSKTN